MSDGGVDGCAATPRHAAGPTVAARCRRTPGRCQNAGFEARRVAPPLAQRQDRRVFPGMRGAVPSRARKTRRAVGTPDNRAVMGLHRQAQLQPPRLARPFRDGTSFRAWCSSARSAYIRLSRSSSASTSFRCCGCTPRCRRTCPSRHSVVGRAPWWGNSTSDWLESTRALQVPPCPSGTPRSAWRAAVRWATASDRTARTLCLPQHARCGRSNTLR